MSLETKCLLKAFQLHYRPDNDAKSMVKHLIFLRKFAVLHFFANELCCLFPIQSKVMNESNSLSKAMQFGNFETVFFKEANTNIHLQIKASFLLQLMVKSIQVQIP